MPEESPGDDERGHDDGGDRPADVTGTIPVLVHGLRGILRSGTPQPRSMAGSCGAESLVGIVASGHPVMRLCGHGHPPLDIRAPMTVTGRAHEPSVAGRVVAANAPRIGARQLDADSARPIR